MNYCHSMFQLLTDEQRKALRKDIGTENYSDLDDIIEAPLKVINDPEAEKVAMKEAINLLR